MMVFAAHTAVMVVTMMVATNPDGGTTNPAAQLAPSAPPPSAGEYPLKEAKNGSGELIYEGKGFAAHIARDGSVRFDNKHVSLLSVLPFLPTSAPQNVPSLQATVRGLLKHRTVPTRDPLTPTDSSFLVIPLLTPYRPDPTEACRQCSLPLDLLPFGVAGRSDITDEVMRMSGQDPYRYEKARFLVATRELRVRKAAQVRAENMRSATADLTRQLREIACDSRRSMRERRQIIEKLRQDLDDTSEAGRSAVAAIDRFVGDHSSGVVGAGVGGAAGTDSADGELCPSPVASPAPR